MATSGDFNLAVDTNTMDRRRGAAVLGSAVVLEAPTLAASSFRTWYL
jgi:hypothetical protein